MSSHPSHLLSLHLASNHHVKPIFHLTPEPNLPRTAPRASRSTCPNSTPRTSWSTTRHAWHLVCKTPASSLASICSNNWAGLGEHSRPIDSSHYWRLRQWLLQRLLQRLRHSLRSSILWNIYWVLLLVRRPLRWFLPRYLCLSAEWGYEVRGLFVLPMDGFPGRGC